MAMRNVIASLLVVGVTCGILGAQVHIHSPADITATDVCSAVPFACLPPFFGGPGYTWVQSVPAALLDPANPEVHDVAFASCTGTGTFSSLNCILGIGHVPDPMPDPFVFPDPGTGTLGSFLDLTVFWDGQEEGVYSWLSEAATWSPLGVAAKGGTGFAWNGSDDVAVFIAHQQSAAIPSFVFSGVMHGAPLDRSRASLGFLASTSQPMGPTMTDLKMRLSCFPAGTRRPRFDLAVDSDSAGGLTISVSNLPAGTQEGWLLLSDQFGTQPVGLVPPLGLLPSPLALSILSSFPAASAGHPFHWLTTDPAVWPNTPLVLPPGTTAALAGIQWDWMAVTVDAGGLAALSNVVRRSF